LLGATTAAFFTGPFCSLFFLDASATPNHTLTVKHPHPHPHTHTPPTPTSTPRPPFSPHRLVLRIQTLINNAVRFNYQGLLVPRRRRGLGKHRSRAGAGVLRRAVWNRDYHGDHRCKLRVQHSL